MVADAGDENGESDDNGGDGDGDGGDGDGDGDGDGGPICGNAVIEAGEDCDDGNDIDSDECTNACSFAACGDGIVHEGVEQCDDGDADPFDDCTNDCESAICGDGIVQGDEQCDAGPGNGDDQACKADCTDNVCGDGFRGPGEGCDDGNQVDDDECKNNCVSASCGDGAINDNDECDDGNVIDDDGCTNACTLPVCGDGLVQAGEQCDQGNGNSPNAECTTACELAECGDGHVWAGHEECDGGAANGPGQACKADCTDNYCGDADVGPGEQCDNGSNGPGLECLANCTNNVCGDGDKGPNEGCDDGNQVGGDGCSPECAIENPPPMAIPCGNAIYQCGDTLDNDNDGLIDLDDPDCTTPCDDKENSLQTDLPGQNQDCKQDCYWDSNSGQGDDQCVWNLQCDPENPGDGGLCEYNPNLNPQQCDLSMPQSCLNFCVPITPNGCDCFGCCLIQGQYIYLDSSPECSMDNLDACNNCTFFDVCNNPCDPDNCELCFGQDADDLPPHCQEPTCDFGSPCLEQSDCSAGEFCQTGCCSPIVPG
ncbi:MAG TPA: DUF4215 domain-containing protein [Enhygromyxa sp.]|nr:DUF4215 domain-containing protein [Enhygromyxa sp.]